MFSFSPNKSEIGAAVFPITPRGRQFRYRNLNPKEYSMKTVLRFTIIGAVLIAGVALLAGTNRIGAAFEQVQTSIGDAIDSTIDDPVALRRQLRQLEKEYPKRISTVRGDLAELQHQIGQLERDQQVAKRVIEIARSDYSTYGRELDNFQATVASHASNNTQISRTITPTPSALNRLHARMDQAQNTALAYSQRAQDATRDLGYLQQQEERMIALLSQLEGEHAQFRVQLMQLDRQVDSVARNERLISLMEKRQETISELSRYDAGSLDQVQGKLNQIRAKQEAELELLANAEYRSSYENRARFEINSDSIFIEEGELILEERPSGEAVQTF